MSTTLAQLIGEVLRLGSDCDSISARLSSLESELSDAESCFSAAAREHGSVDAGGLLHRSEDVRATIREAQALARQLRAQTTAYVAQR